MDVEEALRSLNFIKNVEIKDIVSYKDSAITKTLNDIYFNDFDKIEEAIKELEEMQIKVQNPRTLKRFKIELQPMRKKQNVHYSNHIIDYINFNIRSWYAWDRLPITITDNTTQKQIILTKDDYFNWKEKMYEWLKIPKELLEVI